MKYTRRFLVTLVVSLLFATCIYGCSKKTELISCPFTNITWENTLEEIQAESGELLETRDSIYDGSSYLYEKEYLGYDGTVYYIFDDKEKLVSMAWGYSTDSSEELDALHKKLTAEIEDTFGECDYTPQVGYGSVWYTDGGNVVLFTIDTEEYKTIQVNYVHPDVAEEE